MKPLAAPVVTRLTFLQRKLAVPSRCVFTRAFGSVAPHRAGLHFRYLDGNTSKSANMVGSTNANAEMRERRRNLAPRSRFCARALSLSLWLVKSQKVIVEDNCLFEALE